MAEPFGDACGDGATARTLCADTGVAGIHFTGSERAGRELAQIAASRFARCALEMSGLNPAVVFADADLDRAADCIVASATALAGQKCTATRQVIVAESALHALTGRLAARIEALHVGDPRNPATDVGPLITPAARMHAEARVQASLDTGAQMAARSRCPQGEALFAPTLLAALAPDDDLRTEELFAPVLTMPSRRANTPGSWPTPGPTDSRQPPTEPTRSCCKLLPSGSRPAWSQSTVAATQ